MTEKLHATRRARSGDESNSSKLSQMRTAHSRYIEYGEDERDGADWMKAHLLVGAETLVCIAVDFSGTRGIGTHDSKFVLPLIDRALRVFDLHWLLADKAYLSEEIVGGLAERGLKAVIPIKKRIDPTSKSVYYQAFAELVHWFDFKQAHFHEYYRFRPKVESFFAVLKRVADGYCWSRGRPRKDANGEAFENAERPCVAWVNEALCKIIYINLRTTVHWEQFTGYKMNYLMDRFFPAIPDHEKIIA